MKSHLAQRERRYKIHESGAELSIYEYYHVSGKRRDSSVLPGKKARVWTITLLTVLLAMSGCVLAFVLGTGESYVYMMGHFPHLGAMRSASAF